MKKRIYFLLGLFLAAFTSCSTVREGRIFGLEGGPGPVRVEWTGEERAKPVVIKTLKSTQEASYHVVRLLGSEKPHVHDTHDGAVFMLTGRVLLHSGGKEMMLKAGDVATIPRGTPHWAENKGRGAAMAYVVFTPAFDGTDVRPIAS